MAGRYIKLANTNTEIDGFWFEILSVGSTGALYVREPSPNLTSGTSHTYVISELIPIPDGFEDLPLWYALDRYYQMKEKPNLAKEYERFWRDGLGDLTGRDSRSVTGIVEKEVLGDTNIPPDINSNPWLLGTLK